MKRHDDELASYGAPWSEPTPPPPPPPPTPPDTFHSSGAWQQRAPQNAEEMKHIGVIVGRFRPPHFGHEHLVNTAFSRCGLLYVLSPSHGNYSTTTLQSTLVRTAFADRCTVVPFTEKAPTDPRSPDFAKEWAAIVRKHAPNATRMFSSDVEGAAVLADELGVEHIVVDADRTTRPISAARIRKDLFGHFHWVLPSARAILACQVAIIGAECAGKTTLARELGVALDAPVVEDQLRLEATRTQAVPSQSAFMLTLNTARDLSLAAARDALSGVVINDNTAFLARLWAERLGVTINNRMLSLDSAEQFHLWLLCHDDFDFVGPPERDQPGERRALFEQCRRSLPEGANVVEIHGTDGAARVTMALAAVHAARDARARKITDMLRGA